MAADTAPAGGAAIAEVILATGGAIAATTALVVLGWAHRTGRTTLLRRLADFAGRETGLAPWAAIPSVLAMASLMTALVGMYWDISLHIDQGRDEGPLANPAHYLILFGLFGIFAAGFMAIVLPEGRPSRSAVRIAGEWYAPLGGIAILAAAGFALLGFPLDDVWHRLFGQDVTLWGPTHLMLIGGAGLTLIGSAILIVEGRGATAEPRRGRGLPGILARYRRVFAMGGLLIGLSTFQGEFDFGVPQFQMVLEPVMLAFAAGVALVAARIWIGPGAALGAAVFFIVVRGAVAVIVGPVLGEVTPHLPLYLVEALCVEAAALVLSTRRPYAFGALAGGLVGTLGFAAEYGWSHVWMPMPWPEGLIAEAVVPTVVAGVAAGMIGAFLGSALSAAARPEATTRAPGLVPAAVATGVIALVVGLNVGNAGPPAAAATVTLDEVTPPPERTVAATVRLDPATTADDATWLSATAWQGGGFHLDHLERVGPGVYRTTEPLPVHGTWKAMIRLHDGDSLAAAPVYLPRDTAIPAPEVPATARFTRTFVDETEILQREKKDDVPGFLAALAYTTVGAIVLGLLAMLAWILVRLGGTPATPPARRDPSRAGAGRGAREATA